MKTNPDQDHTPHWGARENFNKKRENAMIKPKRYKSSRNSNARGHAQITRKSDIQDKVSMPQQSNKKEEATNQKRAAKENMNDIKSQIVDSDPWSLKP